MDGNDASGNGAVACLYPIIQSLKFTRKAKLLFNENKIPDNIRFQCNKRKTKVSCYTRLREQQEVLCYISLNRKEKHHVCSFNCKVVLKFKSTKAYIKRNVSNDEKPFSTKIISLP